MYSIILKNIDVKYKIKKNNKTINNKPINNYNKTTNQQNVINNNNNNNNNVKLKPKIILKKKYIFNNVEQFQITEEEFYKSLLDAGMSLVTNNPVIDSVVG